ncbi:MAG TPA: HEAT repeat domain-containing protein [bacterium]|nr:HEAT repeat domain-containing protein [bacterium]
MAMKLPRVTIEELDSLVDQLNKPDVQLRDAAMARLADYERAGRVPLEALLEFSESENASLSMYAISALGRNGEPAAVKKLIDLAERHRTGNSIFLEQIIDALGETRNTGASSVLLSLLGIRGGWSGKLFGRKGRKEDEAPEVVRIREAVTLAVLRALEKIEDPKAAELLGEYLEHPEPLVRWHAVQNLVHCNVAKFNDRLREMAAGDKSELVREAASLAVDRLEPLPPNLNN